MKNIQLSCKTCEAKLIEILTLVPQSEIVWNDMDDILGENQCAFLEHNGKTSLVTNLTDGNLINHPDSKRFSGCCGSSGSDGMNKLCKNGHEVATEFSDCWTSYYLEFNLDHVSIEEITDNNSES